MYNLELTYKALRSIVYSLPNNIEPRHRWKELYSAAAKEWGIINLNITLGDKRTDFRKDWYIVTQPKMLGKLYLTALRIWQEHIIDIDIQPVLIWDDFIELIKGA